MPVEMVKKEIKREIKKPFCHMSHTRCGMLATVEDGVVTHIEGNPATPVNQGKLCERSKYALDFHNSPNRVNYPMKRVGPRGSGQFERISWDQANQEIAGKLKELIAKYGPECICNNAGTGRTDIWERDLFFNMLDAPNSSSGGSQICYSPSLCADTITYGQFAVSQVMPRTNCIVWWGKDSAESGDFPEHWGFCDLLPITHPKMIVVDPRCTDYARRADHWLPLRNGTDGAMALAWLNVIITEELYDKDFVAKWVADFDKLKEAVKDMTPEKAAEITWVSAEKIAAAARCYAECAPEAAFLFGLATDASGYNSFQTNRAKGLIRAIVGSLNNPGGTYLTPPHNAKFHNTAELSHPEIVSQRQKDKTLGMNRYKLGGRIGYDEAARVQKRIFKKDYINIQGACCSYSSSYQNIAMLTGQPYPVKAFFEQGSHAYTNQPESKTLHKALHQCELIVIHEYVWSASACMADYVLPSADFLEKALAWPYPLWGLCNDMFWFGEKAIEPQYERRDCYTFWRELAKLLHPKEKWEKYYPWETTEDTYVHIMSPLGYKTYQECLDKPYIPSPVPMWHEENDPETGEVLGFATPSGKVECFSNTVAKFFDDESAVPFFEEPFESPVRTPDVFEEYPLIMCAGARFMPYYLSDHRGVKGFRNRYPDPYFQIHNETAAELGIGDGHWCWIESRRGRFMQRAKLCSDILPKTIFAQHGWYYPELPHEEPWTVGWFMSNPNVALSNHPDHNDPYQGGCNIKGSLVKVYRAGEPPFNTWTK
ncbi:MAG: molybdopterin-dependent oxidoreductase [Proteobacteria bacterium]|nr:molybdopterin-dependent oxidoreductase [Pseudomonadota bacterium]